MPCHLMPGDGCFWYSLLTNVTDLSRFAPITAIRTPATSVKN